MHASIKPSVDRYITHWQFQCRHKEQRFIRIIALCLLFWRQMQGTLCCFGIILYHLQTKATYNLRAYYIHKIRALVASSVWLCQVDKKNKGNHVLCCELTNFFHWKRLMSYYQTHTRWSYSPVIYPLAKSGEPIKTCNILPVPA